MQEQQAVTERPIDPVDPASVLAGLAQQFALFWQRAQQSSSVDACAQLNGEFLLFSLDYALTPEQAELANREDGYLVVVRNVSLALDRIYAELAHEIERSLHCYVGPMQVDVAPQRCAIHVQFHLRDAPGLWRLSQLSTKCS